MSSYSNRRANFFEAGRQLTAHQLLSVEKYHGERVQGALLHAPKASLLAKPMSAAEVLLLLGPLLPVRFPRCAIERRFFIIEMSPRVPRMVQCSSPTSRSTDMTAMLVRTMVVLCTSTMILLVAVAMICIPIVVHIVMGMDAIRYTMTII